MTRKYIPYQERHSVADTLKPIEPLISSEAIELVERLRKDNARLQERNLLGESAIQVLAAISSLVPLADSLAANENGQTLVDYFARLIAERKKLVGALREISKTPNAGWIIARSTLSQLGSDA